jgi:hypothetical protein
MANQLLLLLHATRARLDIAVDVIILLLTPAFLCLVVPDWIFTQIGYIDPYIYLGYIRNFSHFITVFGGTYYATRLPFIIPGYICYKIFPPLVANYVLHLGFYYLALFSLYFILRMALNRRAALLTSVFMGFYPYFMAATGWDYVDGAGIAYFLLTVLLLTLAIKNTHIAQIPNLKQGNSSSFSKKFCLLLFMAGLSLAALIYTNTFLLIVIPPLVVYYLIMIHQRSWNLLLKAALIAGSGGILATIFLGIVNVAAGGSFLFFTPSFLVAGSLLIRSNPYLTPGYTWLIHVPFMVFPFFILLTSLLAITVSWIRVKSSLFKMNSISQVARDNIFSLCHVMNFLLMLTMQLLGKPVFQLQYYASYLLPTAFLAAGAQLAAPLSHLSKKQYTVIAVIAISLLAGSYLIYYHTPLRSAISCHDSIWYVSAVLVAGALCLLIVGKSRRIINTLLVGLALAFFAPTNITLIATNPDQIVYCACGQGQQNFLAVIKSDDIIRTYDTDGNMRFWYSKTEPLGGLYTSIASTRLWGYRLINDTFPEIAELDYPGRVHETATIKIPPAIDIVILSNDKDVLAKANAALNLLGLEANLVRTEEITQGSISFTMTFIRTQPYQTNQQSQRLPPF